MNMTGRTLPMANPFVTSYQNVANVLAILLTQEEAARAWISDHYVQLVFKSNNTDGGAPVNFLEAMPNGRMSTVFSCPFLETQKLERRTVDFAKRGFIDFVKYCIDDGLYISVVLNHYHLPSSASYQKQVNCHQVYIYGYDEKTVCIADFFHGKYQFGSASYDEINEAYRTGINDHAHLSYMNCDKNIYLQYALSDINVTVKKVYDILT